MNVPAGHAVLPAELVEEIADLIGVRDSSSRAYLHQILPHQAQSYQWGKALLDADRPHRSRDAVLRTAAALTAALEALDEVGLEQSVALAHLYREKIEEGSLGSLTRTRQDIKTLRDAAAAWTDRYKPTARRPRHRSLELHIGALMLLFEEITGVRATVSLTRNGCYEPRLTSPQAKAIGMLLRAVDPQLTDTAVANKIDEIRKLHKGQGLRYFEPVLRAGGARPVSDQV
jgi:hypothetical protein